MSSTPLQSDVAHCSLFMRLDRGVLERLWPYIHPHRTLLVAAWLAVLLYAGVHLAIPINVRYAVDAALAAASGGSDAALGYAIGSFAALVAANAVLSFLQEWLAIRLAERVILKVRRAVFEQAQSLSMSTMDGLQVGHLMSRLVGDVNALQEFVESSVTVIGDVSLLIGIVVAMLLMDTRLALATMAVLPIVIAVRVLWLPHARRAFARARETSSIVNAALAENINGVRTVQECRRQKLNLALYAVKAEAHLEAQVSSTRIAQVIVPTVDAMTGTATAVVVLMGGYAVIAGTMGVGTVVAFLFFVQRFFDPIRALSAQYTSMQRAMASGERIIELLDMPVLVADRPGARDLPDDFEASVVFDSVGFSYRPGQPVLCDFHLEVAAGKTVAIAGPTGAGKSTIAALAVRLYDVERGGIRIAGVDVRELTRASLASKVSLVLQDPFLFSGSVLDNLRYAAPRASREAAIAAAQAVHAHEFISALPQGYDTPLGQRGRNLSAGQRQLIGFARVLLADPKILILDEATASIDSQTEQAIQEAFSLLRRGRTTIVIAHRLATIREADHIVVLDGGRVAEAGTHASLLAEGGLYASLCRSFPDAAAGACVAKGSQRSS
jgi:ATP-binding cassette subfamily B multidrug efflux pump